MSPEPGATVEYSWSSYHKRLYPLHQPELVEKALMTANWIDDYCRRRFLSEPPVFEDTKVPDGERVWFCNALRSLTRDEMIKLYDTLIASSKACLETGGDFSAPAMRARMPHIYGPIVED